MVGLDIGTTAVRLLELAKLSLGYRVLSYAVVPLPVEAIIEKEFKDYQAISEAVREAVLYADIKNKNTVLAVPDSSVVSKVIQLDANLDDYEMEEQIQFEADQYISFPIEDIYFDFQVLGINASNSELVDVQLHAAHKRSIELRRTVVEDSGLNVKVLELESHALMRSCALAISELMENGKIVAIVDIGFSMINVYMVRHGRVIFTRGEHFSDQYIPQKETIILLIRRALQFFFSIGHELPIQCLLLTGGRSLYSGLAAYMHEKLDIPVSFVNPFKYMTAEKDIDLSAVELLAPCLMLSCGLALRENIF